MKTQYSKAWIVLLIAIAVLAGATARAQVSLISTGAVWKYLDNGSDQGTAWTATDFDDSGWAAGRAQLGYGDGDEATTVGYGPDANNKFITTYFRQTFSVADASSITNLRVLLKRDDGAIGYLNGVEVFRDNMPAGTVYYTNVAATTASDDGQNFWPHGFSAGALVSGDNVLAVEVHQSAGNSSDISFDLELDANPQPSIVVNSPTNGQTIASATVSIVGSAVPGGSNVTVIEAYANGSKVGQSSSPDFNIAWSGVSPGSYTVFARVIDSSGLIATSAPSAITVQAAPATMLLPRNSVWNYNNLNIDLGTAWLALAYDDSPANGWGAATAPLGYNFESPNNYITSFGGTEINIAPDNTVTGSRYPTLYFRKTVNVSQAASYQGLILRVMRDDAAFIYLNGQFVTNVGCAGNVELDPPTLPHNQFCCSQGAATGGAEEYTYFEYRVPSTFLVNGPNIFAVEGRNQAASSSDLAFDMEVEGVIDLSPPIVGTTDPEPESVVSELNHIDVAFNEAVTGVNASDLLINSEPATNVVAISTLEYTFYFATPNTGVVQVAWAPNHGITDTAPIPNAFGGGSWTYTYKTNIAQPGGIIISEFMANNNAGIKDPLDGKRYDWIELYNTTQLPVNLAGWFLTDSSSNLTLWRFPAVNIQPNSYLVAWAAGKTDPTPFTGTNVYTNFKLATEGGYLALVDPNTNVISAFDPYPAQQPDISYGRDRVDPSIIGYFSAPTPGSQNSTEGNGFAVAPVFSVPSGVYTNDTLTVSISGPPGAFIRYTTDGTVPTNSSPQYSGSITLSNNATIKARAFSTTTGIFPSPVVALEVVFLDSSVRDFNSNLPLLILDSRSTIQDSVPPGGTRAHGNFVILDTVGGRTYLRETPDYVGLSDFEIFGQTSPSIWGPFAKKPYRLQLTDEIGNGKDVSILGMPADSDWKLRANWEKSLMNDFLGFELFEQMGHYSVRRRFVEVFVHQGSGKLTAADYNGIQPILETIKIGNHRVDLQKLTSGMTNEPDISGGYIFKKDKDSTGDLNFTTAGFNGFPGQPNGTAQMKFHDPKPRELIGTAAGTNQQRYLVNYLNQMEKAIYQTNYLTATGTNHYSYYMDVDGFVDQFWIMEFTKQIDGYRLSDYFSKDRNGKVTPVPVWDWNLSFGNANYLDCGHYTGWYWTQLGFSDHPWVRRLITGSQSASGVGDPDFCQKIADRWGVLRTNVMSGSRVLSRIDEIVGLLYEGATRPGIGDFTKPGGVSGGTTGFQRLGVYQWPEPNGPAGTWDVDFQDPLSYVEIINQLKKWVNGRYNWVESQFVLAPTFSQDGGTVAGGTTITLTPPAGAVIYYTLDGSDPRGSAGVTNGTLYAGPITVNGNVRIAARARKPNGTTYFQNTWSPMSANSYAVATPGLRITEIMYHPTAILGNTNDNDNFEYVEVQNISGTPLNVNRFTLGGGVQFQFPNAVLAAGEYAVVVKDTNAFQLRYGTNTVRILGTYTGSLANDGDHLVLSGPVQEPILDFSYKDGWYPTTDGTGFSLVINDPAGPTANWGLASGWHASAGLGGSPGAVDPTPPARPGILVNEVRSHSDPVVDAIELYNPTAGAVNIGGWFLSDDFNRPKKFIIPPTTIAAGGYVTFTANDFNANTNDPNSFALGSNGDDVWLFSGSNGTDLTGYAHGFSFGASELGVTFGRHVDSTGDEHFVRQVADTIGAGNAGPAVGPIVISEINYHPSDIVARTNGLDNTTDEYIELQNITGSPVNLFDSTYQNKTWHLRSAVDFNFPTNVTVPAHGYVLVVGFDPALDPNLTDGFRQRMNVPVSVPVFGPWSGHLQNDDETIELHRPRSGDSNGVYVLVESVHYKDVAPWPVGADGFGLTLQRIVPGSFGNDPANWAQSAPTPGSAYVSGSPPIITSQPTGQTVVGGTDVTLTATASGSAPLRFQWRYQGEPLAGGTNATLVLQNFQLSQAGVYNLLVMNGGGYTIGTDFIIHGRIPLQIISQPQNATNVLLGTSTNFTIAAISQSTDPAHPSATKYQWYFNGTPINNATNSTFAIASVQFVNAGSYYCVVRDDAYGDVLTSAIAVLTPVAKPGIAFQPSVFVGASTNYAVEGGNASFSIICTGSVPMNIRWRAQTNNAGVTAFLSGQPVISGATNSVLLFNNLAYTTNLLRITAVITNIAGQAPVSAAVFLVVLKDSDHDGLPDLWETNRPGFNVNDPSDGARDDDGDGMSNAKEYIAGTDFSNSNSVLRVQIVPPGIGRVQFTSVTNRTYTVQYTDSLSPPLWGKLADVLGRNRTETVIDPNATTNRFYRVVIPAQP